MNQTELTRLTQEELDDNSGAGFLAIAGLAVPLIAQLVNSGVQAYKTITSKSGSYKTKDSEYKWEDESGTPKSAPKQAPTTYYVY